MSNEMTNLVMLAVLAICIGCSEDVQSESTVSITPQAVKASSPDVGVVGTIVAEKGDAVPLESEPAERAHTAMRTAFEKGVEFATPVKVYAIEPSGRADPEGRALQLGFRNPERSQEVKGNLVRLVSADAPEVTLDIDSITGTETLKDSARSDRNNGATKDLGNAAYVEVARGYLAKSLKKKGKEHFLYKVIRTMDAVADGMEKPVVTLGHVRVAFSDSVDGIPVIGAGSKIRVLMDPSGSVTGHLDSMRDIKAEPIALLRITDLENPVEAQAEIEARLVSEGTNLDHYNLGRREFGYMRWSPDHDQKILAPYYCFQYVPRAGAVAQGKMECVTAVRDAVLRAQIEGDAPAETPNDGFMSEHTLY